MPLKSPLLPFPASLEALLEAQIITKVQQTCPSPTEDTAGFVAIHRIVLGVVGSATDLETRTAKTMATMAQQ